MLGSIHQINRAQDRFAIHQDPLQCRVFLGGVGSLRGVLVGAVLFTALPEVLRLAPTWRLVIYGVLLLLVVVRSPEGIESLLRRATRLGAARA